MCVNVIGYLALFSNVNIKKYKKVNALGTLKQEIERMTHLLLPFLDSVIFLEQFV